MSCFFSVVMPVYNVEKTLKKAATSILKQTYTDFELILVNDCSTDNSFKICENLQATDERCKVINLKENSGLSNTRNQGMMRAQGEYILFVDSDDYVDCQMLHNLFDEIKKHSSDVVIFGMEEIFVDVDGELLSSNVLKEKDFFSDDVMEVKKKVLEIQSGFLFRNSCNKAYKHELIIKIGAYFQTIPCVEDITFNLGVFEHITSLSILSYAPYRYVRKTEGTLTGRFFSDFWEVHYHMLLKKISLFEKWGMQAESQQSIFSDYVKFVFLAIMNNIQGGGVSDKEQKSFIDHVIRTPLYRELNQKIILKDTKLRILNYFLQRHMTFILLSIGKISLFVKVKAYLLWVKVIR